MQLQPEEVTAIFREIDRNNSGTIDYNELVEMFSAINTAQMIRKLQKFFIDAKVEPEFYFN